jgi:flagellar biosynthetic protein FliO
MIAISSLLSLLLAVIPTEPVSHSSAIDFSWMFVKMLGILGFVSVLAVLVLKYAVPHVGIIKKFQRGGSIKVLERTAIEPKKSLYLVEAFKRYFVIGVSEHGINLLAEIDSKSIDNENCQNDGASQ